jgi:hypothetical protein
MIKHNSKCQRRYGGNILEACFGPCCTQGNVLYVSWEGILTMEITTESAALNWIGAIISSYCCNCQISFGSWGNNSL